MSCSHPYNDCQGLLGGCAEKLCPRVNLFPFDKTYYQQNKAACKFTSNGKILSSNGVEKKC